MAPRWPTRRSARSSTRTATVTTGGATSWSARGRSSPLRRQRRTRWRAVTPGSMLALRALGTALACTASGRFQRGMGGPYAHRGITLTRPTRTFSGRLELDVGGRKVELIEVGPAHTHGDLIVHVPDARVVFAADVAFIGSTPGDVGGAARRLAPRARHDRGARAQGGGAGPRATDRISPVSPMLRAYWPLSSAGRCRRDRARDEIVTSDDVRGAAVRRLGVPERAVINAHTLARHRSGGREPRPPDVGAPRRGRPLAAELPGRSPTASSLTHGPARRRARRGAGRHRRGRRRGNASTLAGGGLARARRAHRRHLPGRARLLHRARDLVARLQPPAAPDRRRHDRLGARALDRAAAAGRADLVLGPDRVAPGRATPDLGAAPTSPSSCGGRSSSRTRARWWRRWCS